MEEVEHRLKSNRSNQLKDGAVEVIETDVTLEC